MPLPAALAARLAKRGIIKTEEKSHKDDSEEVFAEDYDDVSKGTETSANQETVLEKLTEALVHEVPACPNRWNPYHECVAFCQEKYGFKTFIADADMDRKRYRMLSKYPLPENWQEVGDPETNRYYYWNVETDEVSWLSPLHPKSVMSPGVFGDKLKGVIPGGIVTDVKDDTAQFSNSRLEEEMEQDFEEMEKEVMSDKRSDKSRDRKHDRRERDRDRDRDRDRERDRDRDRDRDKRGKRRRRDEDELDPMDPASYSDVGRGTWSTGLDRTGEAKTGVDVTASGPLFQQRPYPSPGAILRANKQMQESKE